MTETRIAYLGLDHHHCPPYLESLEALPAEVVSAYEPNPSFDADSVPLPDGVPVYEDLEDALDRDVDAVWITLPNRETPGTVERAVEGGLDVYTEKPGARSAAELEPVRDAAADSDATVMVSYPWRNHPIARELRDRREAGFYGDVSSISARFVASALETRDPDHYIYSEDASGGGILQWLGIHWIDLMGPLLEDPVARVSAQTTSRTPGVDVEDGVTLQFETAGGTLGTLQAGYYLREGQYDTQLNVYGTEGQSWWDPMGRTFGFDGETELELDSRSEEWASTPHRTLTYEYDPGPGYGGAWGLEFIAEFFECRESGASPPVDLDDALEVLSVLDAAYEAADSGKWVAVDR